MAFAGVDIDKAVTEAGLDGKPASDVSGGAADPGASSGNAPDVKDKGNTDPMAALMGDDNGSPKAGEPTDPAERQKQAQAIEDFLDLEANKAKKVKIGDQELTLEELQKGYLRQQDYTKKTQESAKDREFRDNLAADLEKVEKDPTLLAEFQKLYPKQYHKAAELAARGVTASERGKNPEPGKEGEAVSPEIAARLKKLEEAENSRLAEAREREIKSYESEIENTMKELAPKFPLAHDDLVLSKASSLLSYMRQKAVERGDDPGSVKLTKTHWERVYKLVHEESEKRYTSHFEKQRQKQQSAHEAGKDVSAGGGLPGQAPKKLKLGEVADHMIASLQAGGAP